jgi:hypothetical protein
MKKILGIFLLIIATQTSANCTTPELDRFVLRDNPEIIESQHALKDYAQHYADTGDLSYILGVLIELGKQKMLYEYYLTEYTIIASISCDVDTMKTVTEIPPWLLKLELYVNINEAQQKAALRLSKMYMERLYD